VKGPIVGFVGAARAAGIRVSVAESLDAVRTVDAVGYADRALLRDALSAVMAKSLDEKPLFERCFDLYFGREQLEPARLTARGAELPGQSSAALSALSTMLLGDDRGALAVAVERAANRAGASAIRSWTQTNMIARRVLDELGFAALAQDLERLRDEDAALAAALAEALEDLRAVVRARVERSLELSGPRRWDDDALAATTLWNLDPRDVARMRVLVRAMAKRLATRYGRDRRARRRGRLDVRRTLRRNMGHDGVPFVTVWKRKKIEKPRVVALCDVSGSVAAFAQLLLLFLHSLGEAISDLSAYAFSNRLIDVGEILRERPVDDAIAEVMRRIGLGSSDYGTALEDFARLGLSAVDRHTSVLILGDARSNDAPPRAEILKTVAERAKRVVWLNPEARSSWGTGDSEMLRYLPYCDVARRCSTLREMERTVAELFIVR
jgi:hypothetical protein